MGNAFNNAIQIAVFSADTEKVFGFYYFMQKKGRKRLA